MFTIRTESIIQMIVDKFLNRYETPILNDDHSITKKGICMELNISAHDYDLNVNISKTIFIMFCGNVSVFWAYAYDEDGRYIHSPSQIKPENWKNTSNHDSCWRFDGLAFLTELYFDFCEKVNPDVAPIKVITEASFPFSWPVKDVLITYKNDGDYFHKIVSVKNKEVE